MSNPFEDFLQDYGEITKEAGGFGDAIGKFTGSDFGKAVIGGFGAAGAAAVIGGVSMGASSIMDAATKKRDFNRMMSYNPDLQEHRDRDPRTFNQMFTSLRTMNTQFSKDPLIAGTYMRRMAENPLTAGGILTESLSSKDKFGPSFIDQAANKGMDSAAGYMAQTARRPVEKVDPLADLRSKAEEARLKGDLAKANDPLGTLRNDADKARLQGILDSERFDQQRRDKIRKRYGMP